MAAALLGGLLIGLGASLLWLGAFRVAGVSGILREALRGRGFERIVSIAFLLGLVAAGTAFARSNAAAASVPPSMTLGLAGLLAGFGARVGGGCTSGHGVCGLSRLSVRSLVATATFMTAGAVTVFAIRHVAGAFFGATP